MCCASLPARVICNPRHSSKAENTFYILHCTFPCKPCAHAPSDVQAVPVTDGDQALPEIANTGLFAGQGVTTLVRLLGQGGRIIDFNAGAGGVVSCEQYM